MYGQMIKGVQIIKGVVLTHHMRRAFCRQQVLEHFAVRSPKHAVTLVKGSCSRLADFAPQVCGPSALNELLLRRSAGLQPGFARQRSSHEHLELVSLQTHHHLEVVLEQLLYKVSVTIGRVTRSCQLVAALKT